MFVAGRRLTSEQMDAILHSFHKSGSPLHLKLMLDMAKQWASYTTVSDMKLGDSVTEVVSLFLQALEVKHGKKLVRHALGYITLSRLVTHPHYMTLSKDLVQFFQKIISLFFPLVPQ